MSSGPAGGAPANVDEGRVEADLRDILDRLDLRLGRWRQAFGCSTFLLGPVGFVVLLVATELRWWVSLLCAGGAFVAAQIFGAIFESLLTGAARRQFDRGFPPGSPARPVAESVLAEMETPQHAEQKLQERLAAESPDRIIRRRGGGATAEQAVQAALDQLQGGPQVAPPAPAAPPPARPGGYYDYIPLEIRPPEDEKKA
jgi:hypothetical protein